MVADWPDDFTVPDSLLDGEDTVLVDGEEADDRRAHALAPGEGGYRVQAILGQGGMGAVYLAADVGLGRDVALKLALEGDEESLARFRNEARITARLNHPGIVRVHDLAGLDRGRPYYVMKRIRGESWRTAMARQGFPARLETLQRVGEAVGHAHSRGILHRDLKPDNVLIGPYGEVVVADWGLAKDLSEPPRPRSSPAMEPGPQATAAGDMVGTPGYAAPEQVVGDIDTIGPASDVYALGSILYEVVAGEPAFPGRSLLEILNAQKRGPRPVRLGFAPREIVAIAMKALAPHPSDRYPTAQALLDDIDRWRTHVSVVAAPDGGLRRVVKAFRRSPRSSTALLVTTLAALVVLPGLVWAWQRAEAQARARSEAAIRSAADRIQELLPEIDASLVMAEEALDSERNDSTAETRLRIATSLLAEARELNALVDSDPFGSTIDTIERSLLLLEARNRLSIRRRPLAEPLVEVRRRGSEWSDVLEALEAARAAGVASDILEPMRTEALGVGPLELRLHPDISRVRLYRLAPDEVEPHPESEILIEGPEWLLPAGGYLLRIEGHGKVPCLLPVYLMRGEDRGRVLEASLIEPLWVPAGYAYVAPGPWLKGESCEFAVMERGYLISTTEISWGEWQAYACRLPGDRRPTLRTYRDGNVDMLQMIQAGHPEDWHALPLVHASRTDLEGFCRWKSENDLRFDYRLPTSEEWERAVRGADARQYSWGDDWDPSRANHSNLRSDSDPRFDFEPVSSGRWLSRSLYGLLRAEGNAAEWTSSSRSGFGVLRPSAALETGLHKAWHTRIALPDSPGNWCGGRLIATPRDQ